VDRRTFLRTGAASGLLAPALLGRFGPGVLGASTVVAQRSGAARAVTPTLFGLNGNTVQSRLRWDRTDVDAALASFGPGTLRYPAGTISNYWKWQDGWFQPNGPWPGGTDDITGQPIPQFDNSLAPFSVAAAKTGAKGVFVPNMLTTSGRLATNADNSAMINDQLQMLHAAVSAGVGVSRVELGNEFYLSGALAGPNGNDYLKRFPTASSYGSQANPWISAIRTAFPNAKIAAVGADATGSQSARRKGWNAGVLSTLVGADELTLHPYIALTDATVTPQSLLSMPHAHVQSLRSSELAAIAGRGMKASVTEFNMVDRTGTVTFAGTWTHGLFIGAYAILLAQLPTISLIDLHNVVGDALSGSMFDSTDGFRSPTPVTTFLARTAMGTAYAALIAAAKGATRGQALSFAGGPTLGGGAPALVGLEFTGGAKHQVIVVNLAAASVALDMSRLFTGAVQWTKTTAPALTTRVTGPSSLTTTNGSTSAAKLAIPAHSLVRLAQ
jgi:hypothetical protein